MSFLQLPWEQLLPHLSPVSLGQLACTCKHLSAFVEHADLRVWQRAALKILGPEHPAVAPDSTEWPTVHSVRAALQRYGEATHNMRQGRFLGEGLHTQLSKCHAKVATCWVFWELLKAFCPAALAHGCLFSAQV